VQDVALGAVLAELPDLVALQAGEGRTWIWRVQDPFQISSVEVIEMGEDGVELALQAVPAVLVPPEGWAVEAQMSFARVFRPPIATNIGPPRRGDDLVL